VTDVAELADRLHRVLMALILRAHRRDRSRVAIGDVTAAQLSILLTLRDQGPIRMAKLAARERVCAPNITVAIRRLETAELVKRSRDPADLRLVLVGSSGDTTSRRCITPKGLALHRESLADSADRRTPATAVRSTPRASGR
jgi:DNA-binding MarR family transcriptional regulator